MIRHSCSEVGKRTQRNRARSLTKCAENMDIEIGQEPGSHKTRCDLIGERSQVVRPASPIAPSGHGRRPQPLALSNRFRFCPAVMNSPSLYTFVSPRSRNCRIPCHYFASPKLPRGRTARSRLCVCASPADTPRSRGTRVPGRGSQHLASGRSAARGVQRRAAAGASNQSANCQRVAPNGSAVATPTTVSKVKRKRCHGGGPALGALKGAVSASPATSAGQPPLR